MTIEYGPRVRVDVSEQLIVLGSLTYTHYSEFMTPQVATSQWPTSAIDFTRYCEDVVDEHFNARRSKGEIFNNPFFSIKTYYSGAGLTSFSGKNQYYRNSSSKVLTGIILEGTVPADRWYSNYKALNPLDYSDMLESCKSKAITMAYGNRSQVVQAASMTLAEGKKTIQGIYEIMFRLAELALAVKRLDAKHIMDEISPGELKNRYMELRYAIRPLMIDASNIMKAIGTKTGKSRHTARGGSSDRVVISDIYKNKRVVESSVGLDASFDFARTSSYIVEARAGVLCDVNAQVSNIWGIDQIAETIWEVIPFSFIFGWFFNIVDIISSWTWKANVTELASWVTVRETLSQSITCSDARWTYPKSFISEIKFPMNMLKTTVTTTRTPHPQRAIIPSIDVNLDCLKVLDLGIILSGILSGKITRFYK